MKFTAQDRSALIRLASSLPKENEQRRAILAGLKKGWGRDEVISPRLRKKYEQHLTLSADLGRKLEQDLRPFQTIKEVVTLFDVDSQGGEHLSEGWWKGPKKGKALVRVKTNGWDEIDAVKAAVEAFAKKNRVSVDPRDPLTLVA